MKMMTDDMVIPYKTLLKNGDVLQSLYIAVWRNNRWPFIDGNIHVGFVKSDVLKRAHAAVGGRKRDIRVVKYVPTPEEKP